MLMQFTELVLYSYILLVYAEGETNGMMWRGVICAYKSCFLMLGHLTDSLLDSNSDLGVTTTILYL